MNKYANKSRFYTSTMSMARKQALASITGFRHGSLPYLGIPLFKGKPKGAHLGPIVDRLHIKMAAWKGSMLTIKGRVQLVNAVRSSILVYTFQVYKWPDSLLNKLRMMIRNFVWSGDCKQKKLCTVARKDVSKDREAGGFAIKDPALVNKASLMHLCWKLTDRKPRTSCFTYIDRISLHSTWTIGIGESILFWTDKWFSSTIVGHSGIPEHLHQFLNMEVANYLVEGGNIPDYFLQKDAMLATRHILSTAIPLTLVPDTLNWTNATDGVLTNKLAYLHICGNFQQLPWCKLIWQKFILPSRSFIFWGWAHDKKPTDDNLKKRGCSLASICCLCRSHLETSSHIFLTCSYSKNLWRWLISGTDLNLDLSNWCTLILNGYNSWSKLVQQIMLTTCYLAHMAGEKQ